MPLAVCGVGSCFLQPRCPWGSGSGSWSQLRGRGVAGRLSPLLSPVPSPLARTPLHYAAANGSYQCTVTLVTAGAAINEADCKGCTPLHYAAASDTYRR